MRITAGLAIAWLIVGTFIAIGVMICTPAPAFGHDAPTGWSYDGSCCAGVDCEPVPMTEIEVTADGYRYKPTGEVIPFGQARKSGDQDFHRCRFDHENPLSKTRCLYAPPFGT